MNLFRINTRLGRMLFLFVLIYSTNKANSQHQQEVASYENVEMTDLVNLNTGNFVYNMPIMQVPGSHGGYTIGLHYHGNIKAWQESSWVGLGWNINPGALVRHVNGSPDDYWGKTTSTTLVNEGNSEGYLSTLTTTKYYNTLTGTNYGEQRYFLWKRKWNGERTETGSLGIYKEHGGKVRVDGDDMVMGIMNIAMAVVSYGSSTATSTAGKIASVAIDLTTDIALGHAISSGASYHSFANATSYTNNMALWYENKHVRNDWVKEYHYRTYLNATIDNTVWGTLYLEKLRYDDIYDLPNCEEVRQNMDLKNAGNTRSISELPLYNDDLEETHVPQKMHDAFMHIDGGAGSYLWSKNPSKLTYDVYQVQGAGTASGVIQPYRTEIGSIETDRGGRKDIESYAISNYINYKPGFRHTSGLNSYTNHLGRGVNNSGLKFDLNTDEVKLSICDPSLVCDPLTAEELADHPAFQGRKLIGGANVNWFTNMEIAQNRALSSGFMNYYPPHCSSVSDFRNSCGDADGIGGFMITAKDGTSYHYALPVYVISEKSRTEYQGDLTTISHYENNNKYASHWLLTAITGSDYIDINNNNIIDDDDWGYWVTLDYNRYSSEQLTVSPEMGSLEVEEYVNNLAPGPDYSSGAVTEYNTEVYYLDAIHTNTHTALFKKSEKETTDKNLKLDEIALFKKEDYKNFDKGNLNAYLNGGSISSSNMAIYNKYLKKQEFTYTYELARNLLTLRSLSTIFPGNKQLIPPYSFEYSNNPALCDAETSSECLGDAWGNYSTLDTKQWEFSRHPDPSRIGNEWCLTSFQTPLGAEIRISYEKDYYSSLFGRHPYEYALGNINDINISQLRYASSEESWVRVEFTNNANFPITIKAGDIINISNFKVYPKLLVDDVYAPYEVDCETMEKDISGSYIVSSNTPGGINLEYSDAWTKNELEANCIDDILAWSFVVSSQPIITINTSFDSFEGGDNRVSQLTFDNNGRKTRTKYIYTTNGAADGPTSGYVLSEPPGARSGLDLYNTKEAKLGLPGSPLCYSRVTILDGYSNNGSYLTKRVYNFKAPNMSMYNLEIPDGIDQAVNGNENHRFKYAYYVLHDRTAQIGRLESITEYNPSGDLLNSYSITYSENIVDPITHGTVMVEQYDGTVKYDRVFRTSIIEYPNIPVAQRIKSQYQDVTITSEDIDVLSERFLTKTTENHVNGDVSTTKTLPAYKIYPEMGPKGQDTDYKNMLNQSAGSIAYINNKPVSSSIQTWKGDWRNSNGNYGYPWWNENLAKYEYTGTDGAQSIWRKHKSFIWGGDLDNNGSYASIFDEFKPLFEQSSTSAQKEQILNSITGDPSKKWIKTSEVTHYDHFSTPIEVMDVNGDYAATKKDPNNEYTVASAINAKHSQFAHCSFEYAPYSTNQAECGVALVSPGNVSSAFAHTGNSSLYIPSGTGAYYNIPNSIYMEYPISFRISVWVYDPGGLYGKIDDSGNPYSYCYITSEDGENLMFKTFRAKNWIQVSSIIKFEHASIPLSIEINSTGNSPIYIDDLRISPLESAVTSFTYDRVGNITSESNSNNFATKYTYDAAGRLINTYIEKPTGFERISNNKYTSVGTEDDYITVSPANFAFHAGASKGTINISTNTSWEIINDSEWLTVDKTDGFKDGKVTINCAAFSESGVTRSADIIISTYGLLPDRTFNVTQRGYAAPSLPSTPCPDGCSWDPLKLRCWDCPNIEDNGIYEGPPPGVDETPPATAPSTTPPPTLSPEKKCIAKGWIWDDRAGTGRCMHPASVGD